MKIGVIGVGRLGSALVRGFLRAGVKPKDLIANDIDAEKLSSLRRSTGIKRAPSNRALVEGCDVVFISVKPKELDGVLSEIAEVAGERLITSTVAGARVRRFESKLKEAKVVRTMPNIACSVGEGMMVYCFGRRLRRADRKAARGILHMLGPTLELPEDAFDLVTGLSGSGPAYFSLVVKALAEAGARWGLSKEAALKLASQTAKGTGEMLLRSGLSPEELIEVVTSPGGTTEAGLEELERMKVVEIFKEAVSAATERAKELKGGRPVRGREFERVAVGGTFDYLHDGHIALLRKAFEIGDRVLIGVCSDDMQELLLKDSAGVMPLEARTRVLKEFLRGRGWHERAEIVIISDPFGPAVEEAGLGAIVVSPETRKRAEEINVIRKWRGLAPIQIVEIPFVLAEDGKPISSLRIRYGEIDARGKLRQSAI